MQEFNFKVIRSNEDDTTEPVGSYVDLSSARDYVRQSAEVLHIELCIEGKPYFCIDFSNDNLLAELDELLLNDAKVSQETREEIMDDCYLGLQD